MLHLPHLLSGIPFLSKYTCIQFLYGQACAVMFVRSLGADNDSSWSD